jgi:hypothetical protein
VVRRSAPWLRHRLGRELAQQVPDHRARVCQGAVDRVRGQLGAVGGDRVLGDRESLDDVVVISSASRRRPAALSARTCWRSAVIAARTKHGQRGHADERLREQQAVVLRALDERAGVVDGEPDGDPATIRLAAASNPLGRPRLGELKAELRRAVVGAREHKDARDVHDPFPPDHSGGCGVLRYRARVRVAERGRAGHPVVAFEGVCIS